MKRGLVVCAMVMLAMQVSAQSPSVEKDTTAKKPVLTFDHAVVLAMRNAVLLNQQRNQLEYAQMQKLTAFAGALPSINASVSTYRAIGNTFIQKTGTLLPNGTVDNISAGISANMNLFSGFSRVNYIRQYLQLFDAQAYFVKRTAQDAMNTVATQYLAVMQDEELLIIARENHKALVKQLEQIQAQVDIGSKAPVDGYNQGALTKAAELTMINAEITLNNDKATLAQTLLLDAFDEFVTERPNWDVNAIGGEVLNVQEMADRAKQNRADFQRALSNEKAYRYGVYSARGQYLPSVSLGYGYGSGFNYTHGDSNEKFNKQFKENKQQQFSATLSIPIFNGFQNRSFVASQRLQYDNAMIQRQNVEHQIKNDVLRAVRNFDGAKKAFAISAEKLNYAEKALELETERFTLGVSTFVDFANANRVLVQAQADKAQAEYKLVFQKITLSYADGTLQSEDLSKVDSAVK